MTQYGGDRPDDNETATNTTTSEHRITRRTSAASFKFDWMRAVLRDTRFSDAAARVLVFVALNNVKSGECTFCVRQVTIAENTNLTERTVRAAFAQARELGYIELVEERQRGRGFHQADAYGLAIPEIPERNDTYSGINTGTPTQEYRKPHASVPGAPCIENAPLPADSAPSGV